MFCCTAAWDSLCTPMTNFTELYPTIGLQKMHLYTCNHGYCTSILDELYWMFSPCRLSKYKYNFYYYAASGKEYNNKWGIKALCRSNLIGCLQSTVPLRHLIKDYFFCSGSDIVCKQWVLQWVCVGVCVWARVSFWKIKDWRQGPSPMLRLGWKFCAYTAKSLWQRA